MVDNLVGKPELIEKLITQHAANFLLGVLAVQAIGTQEQNVLLFDPGFVEFINDQANTQFAVAGGCSLP